MLALPRCNCRSWGVALWVSLSAGGISSQGSSIATAAHQTSIQQTWLRQQQRPWPVNYQRHSSSERSRSSCKYKYAFTNLTLPRLTDLATQTRTCHHLPSQNPSPAERIRLPSPSDVHQVRSSRLPLERLQCRGHKSPIIRQGAAAHPAPESP